MNFEQSFLSKIRSITHTTKHLGSGRNAGQALVEFALVAPIVIMLIIGTLDIGRAVVSYFTLAHVAREGARIGIYVDTTDAQIRTRINEQAGILGTISDSEITITPSYPRHSGNTLEVVVTKPFDPITPFLDSLWGSETIDMTGTARMKVE